MAGTKNTEAPGAPATSARELEDLLFEELWLDAQAKASGKPRPPGPMQLAYPEDYKAFREATLGLGAMAVSGALGIKRAKTLSAMLEDKGEGVNAIGALLTQQPANDFMRGVMLQHLANLTREKAHPRRGTSSVSDEALRNAWGRAQKCCPNRGRVFRQKKTMELLAQDGLTLGLTQLKARMKTLGI